MSALRTYFLTTIAPWLPKQFWNTLVTVAFEDA